MVEQREGERRSPTVIVSGACVSEEFGSLPDALPSICKNGSNWQHVSIEFQISPLLITVSRVTRENQIVTVEALGKKGKVPRSRTEYVRGKPVKNPGLWVSVDPNKSLPAVCESISIPVGDYDKDPNLDRGLARLEVSDPKNPRLRLDLKPNEYTEEGLLGAFDRVTSRVVEVLMDALDGNVPMPPR